MFGKKNKSAPPADMPMDLPENQAPVAQAPPPVASGNQFQSMFAPSLNPIPANVDFGFHQTYDMPPPPPPMPVQDLTPSAPPAYEPAPYDTSTPGGDFPAGSPAPLAWTTPEPEYVPPAQDFAASTAPFQEPMAQPAWEAPEDVPQPEVSLPPEAANIYPPEYLPQTPPSVQPANEAEALWHQMTPSIPSEMPSVTDFMPAGEMTDYQPAAAPEYVPPAAPSFEAAIAPEYTPAMPDYTPAAAPAYEPLPPLPPEAGTPAWDPQPVNAYEALAAPAPAWDIPLPPPVEDWQAPPSPATELSSWEPVTPGLEASPDATLWNNLDATQSMPGEQVPADALSSGQFLDSVSQLYPEDPLMSLEPAAVLEGEQAFADAAQYLFPETVGAPLEWNQDDTGTPAAPFVPDPMLGMSAMPEDVPVELGPSYQTETAGFSDYATAHEQPIEFEIPLTSPQTGADLPPASAEPYGMELLTQPAAESWAPAQELNQAPVENWAPQDMMSPAPQAETWAPAQDLMPPAAPVADPDYSPSELWFPEGPTPETQTWSPSGLPDADAATGETWPAPQPELHQGLGEPTFDAGFGGEAAGSYLEDQEFYASSFALNDQGEIVPDHGEYVPPPAEAYTPVNVPESAEQAAGEWWQTAGTQPQNGETFELSPYGEEEQTPVSSFYGDEDEEPVSLYTLDLMHEPQPATQAGPVDLDAAWSGAPESPYQPVPVASEPAAAETSTSLFSLENLEILAVCQLTPDKRLLLVQNKGIFALMGQSGLDNPNVSVLKTFDQNPIAYQNTFTAVQEGQAHDQGMFVAQVGTWHAIISTFQNNVTLHTELG